MFEVIKSNKFSIVAAAVIGGLIGNYIYERFLSDKEVEVINVDFNREESSDIHENEDDVDESAINYSDICKLGEDALKSENAKKLVDLYSSIEPEELSYDEYISEDETEIVNVFDYSGDPVIIEESDDIPEEEPTVEYLVEEDDEYVSDIPYPIGYTEFENQRPDYEKVSVVFFEGDDTLATEHDEILDIFDTIGEQIVYDMKDIRNNDIFYSRNDNNKTDYEIRRVKTTYIEHAIGID